MHKNTCVYMRILSQAQCTHASAYIETKKTEINQKKKKTKKSIDENRHVTDGMGLLLYKHNIR